MTTDEFNEKYKDYIEDGHYGLSYEDPRIVGFLDNIFKDLTKIPGFKYSQIKMKFGKARFLSGIGCELSYLIEDEINRLCKIIYTK